MTKIPEVFAGNLDMSSQPEPWENKGALEVYYDQLNRIQLGLDQPDRTSTNGGRSRAETDMAYNGSTDIE